MNNDIIQSIFNLNENKKLIRRIRISAVIVFVVFLLTFLTSPKFSYTSFLSTVTYLFTNSLPLLLSIGASILAALLFNHIYSRDVDARLQSLGSITDQGFLEHLLKEVTNWNHIVCKNHRIDIRFEKITNERFAGSGYHLIQEHHYSCVNRTNPSMRVKIFRIQESNSMSRKPDAAVECLANDHYYVNDERDFPEVSDMEELYDVSRCFVDIEHEVVMERLADEENNTILFEGLLPKSVVGSETLEVSFVVSLPVEIESIYHITHDYPTKGATVTIDYSAVKDEIEVYAISTLGNSIEPIQRIHDEGKIVYQTNSWIMARMGYSVAWWKVEKQI